MFTRESLLASDWYRQRLEAKQRSDQRRWRRKLEYLDAYLAGGDPAGADGRAAAELRRRRDLARAELKRMGEPAYLESLNGTLGLDPTLLPPG